ncbi:hypothetical protein A1O1_01464 [Capronia coronata CBS 617.96]|uniref:Uncharacterized protein n=1 Tax=Capronia coronata CBS 617.96 TaxID=1182541 RepID=W9YV27_9EURO|nr:uncharacterized protein A1O1_01464 [Capronia coronata CBS 617.96]EXJ96338.1 hypothetical protein A1O1_01464 [Capronia coronata CBS 617.96]
MDPATCLSLAAESASICVEVMGQLKRFVEKMKNAKKELQQLLERIQRSRNFFEMLRVMLKDLMNGPARDFALAIDGQAWKTTTNELQEVAGQIVQGKASLDIKAKFHWATKGSAIGTLVKKMKDQEDEILDLFTFINTQTIATTRRDIESIKNHIITQSTLHEPFKDLHIVEEQHGHTPEPAQPHTPLNIRTWLGHILVDGHSEEYLGERTRLADGAYWGRWDKVHHALQVGWRNHGELWGNAMRLQTMEGCQYMSGFTPLHQAAYNGATVEVVQTLLKYGASRTLRSFSAQEFNYPDLTALEIAIALEQDHLFDILAPVVRQPVPALVLDKLEMHFHGLIAEQIGSGRIRNHKIYLPPLEPLTELERNQCFWFPVKLSVAEGLNGFVYQLDGRDLVVEVRKSPDSGESTMWRVTEDGFFEIEDAVLF